MRSNPHKVRFRASIDRPQTIGLFTTRAKPRSTRLPYAPCLAFGALLVAFAVSIRAIGSGPTTSAVSILLRKAETLERDGRVDLAKETWQQLLQTDPDNVDALVGLGRAARISGDAKLAETYLKHLRRIKAADSEIALVESTLSQSVQLQEARRAAKLAEAGKPDQAFEIYRKLFGSRPPDAWAIAYYQTEAATASGRNHAEQQLRSLVGTHPENTRYAVALGRVLTWHPATRAEGCRYLQRLNDPEAKEALAAALQWQRGSGDQGVADPHQPPAPLAAAYEDLNAKRFDKAEIHFRGLLAQEPENHKAAIGLAYAEMGKGDFQDALSLFQQLKQAGARTEDIDRPISDAHFFLLLSGGTSALRAGDLPSAEQHFRDAVTTRPSDPDALYGLAGTLMKAGDAKQAVLPYKALLALKPDDPAAWHGLFQAQGESAGAAAALDVLSQMPLTIVPQLMRNPEFARELAAEYSSAGRQQEALEVLRMARQLPSSSFSPDWKSALDLQYGTTLMMADKPSQALEVYRQLLENRPGDLQAMQGIVVCQHAMHNDLEALATLEQVPEELRRRALMEPEIAETAASVYQALNRLDMAEEILQRALAAQQEKGISPASSIRLQLAGLYLQRKQTERALPLLDKLVYEAPVSVAAWNELLAALHDIGRDHEAVQKLRESSPETQHLLGQNKDSLQTIAAIQEGSGDPVEAAATLDKIERWYTERQRQVPAEIATEHAWSLFNAANEVGLYGQMLALEARSSLDDQQRRALRSIWKSWALRRAGQAAMRNYPERSLEILAAASDISPRDGTLRRALAAQYLQAHTPQRAVFLYEAADLSSATAADFEVAIGAALAANARLEAQRWMHLALAMFPNDTKILCLAAQVEQAHGTASRAASYYRASLVAPQTKSLPAVQEPDDFLPAPVGAGSLDPKISRLARLLDPAQDAATGAVDRRASAAGQPGRFPMTQPSIATNSLMLDREQTERGLKALERQYSGWTALTSTIHFRTGQPGLDQLLTFDSSLEWSVVLAMKARLTFAETAVSLNSGKLSSTSSKGTGLPAPAIGTLSLQSAGSLVEGTVTGVGSELQLATHSAEFSVGHTPSAFPVSHMTARLRYHSLGDRFVVSASRSPIRETQLSFAGLHDPVLSSAPSDRVWGGVIASGTEFQLNAGDEHRGLYLSGAASVLTGQHVLRNDHVEALAGSYLRVATLAGGGAVSLGANLFGMHYAHNERALTYGNGGYFSPARYIGASLPVHLNGTYRHAGTFSVAAAAGLQSFRETSARLFPLDAALQQIAYTGCTLPQRTAHLCANAEMAPTSTIAANFDLSAQTSYRLAPHWYLDASFAANDTNSYGAVYSRATLRYVFRDQDMPHRAATLAGEDRLHRLLLPD